MHPRPNLRGFDARLLRKQFLGSFRRRITDPPETRDSFGLFP